MGCKLPSDYHGSQDWRGDVHVRWGRDQAHRPAHCDVADNVRTEVRGSVIYGFNISA